MSQSTKPNLSNLADNWPSPFVAREEVKRFTGGIINPKTIANMDSQGKGPEGRIRIGRKIAYPVDLFVEWLEQRSEVVS